MTRASDLSAAQRLLLSKCLDGATADDFRGAWGSALREAPDLALARLSALQLIEPAPASVIAERLFTLTQIKDLLRARGLGTSGPKRSLAQRLAEADPAAARSRVALGAEFYHCTTTGREVARAFLEQEASARIEAERRSSEALAARDHVLAAKVVAQFEAGRVFPRGLGIDWSRHDYTHDLLVLRHVFASTPAILRTVDADVLPHLRLAAGMMHLWGDSKGRKWVGAIRRTGGHLDPSTAARMLVFAGLHRAALESYRVAGVRKIQVLAANDADVCPECRRQSEVAYDMDDCPEIPIPGCTSSRGCRCSTVATEF